MGAQATKVTHGIKISIDTRYLSEQSEPEHRHFLFSYHIVIENHSEFTVKLLSRHWDIFDTGSDYREVNGEGVVGEQPVLEPGESFEYESSCNLTTDIGRMNGSYLMERQVDKLQFKVTIPEFELITPFRLN